MSIPNGDGGGGRQVWIGLVTALPGPGGELLSPGETAFAQALAPAVNEGDFTSQVEKGLEMLGLRLAGVEEVEPLVQRLKEWTVDDALVKLAHEVRDTGEVRFHTFHASPDDSDTS